MKRIFLTLFLIMSGLNVGIASKGSDIELLKPNLEAGVNFMKALSERESSREFSQMDITLEDLSNVFWAAGGVNREDGKLTTPTAMNRQEITLYAFLTKGVYRYNRQKHLLEMVAEGDYRALLNGRQDFADKAPLGILMVADVNELRIFRSEAASIAAMDAGIVSQTINLYCASMGLANVPRISMDKPKIIELLKLSETQLPLMNNVVGYRE